MVFSLHYRIVKLLIFFSTYLNLVGIVSVGVVDEDGSEVEFLGGVEGHILQIRHAVAVWNVFQTFLNCCRLPVDAGLDFVGCRGHILAESGFYFYLPIV